MTRAQSSKCQNNHYLTLLDLEYSANKNKLIKKLIKNFIRISKNATNIYVIRTVVLNTLVTMTLVSDVGNSKN